MTDLETQAAPKANRKEPKHQTGVRSLVALAKNASTSRMLNLGLIGQRHGQEPEYAQNPFFRNQILNQCILLKHRVRPEERRLLRVQSPIATKLLFPYDWDDLGLGGRSVLVGEKGFKTKFATVVGEAGSIPDCDWKMLELIDALPSLDPFLLREQLRQGEREVADWYYQLTPGDAERMHQFIASELGNLIRLAFDQSVTGSTDFVSQIVVALLSVKGGARLEPLRLALGLEPEEFLDSIFCWKGFLYYKWSENHHRMEIESVLEDFKRLRVKGAPYPQAEIEFSNILRQVTESINSERLAVSATLRLYEDAYDELIVHRKPIAFRKFLRESRRLFLDIGDKLGVLTHLSSYWKFRFPKVAHPVMPYWEALDLFREFASGFARDQSKVVVWD